MTIRKILRHALPVILFGAAISFWIISIWTGDGRWGWTVVPVMLAASCSLILWVDETKDV